MIKEKYEALIKKLIVATDSGKIEWEKTSSKDEYQTKIGNNAVSVGFFDPEDLANTFILSTNGGRPKMHYYLDVMNSEGVQVDSEERELNDAGYTDLKNLYHEARRKYLKVDETLDAILNNL